MQMITIIIPCYGSSGTIAQVIGNIISTVKSGDDYEIICVIDCSPDDVFDVLTELAKDNLRIKVIELAKNFGQHSAIMAGMKYSKGDTVVCMDDDGQTPPCEMYKLIDALQDCDVAVARYNEKKHSFYRNIGSCINDTMASYLIGKPRGLKFMSYFACKRYIVDEILQYKNSYPYIAGLILRTTKNIKNVEVEHRSRISGDSGYSFAKLISLWLNGFTAFSVKPLRLASVLGFMVSISGFIYGIATIINRFSNPNVPLGYSSIMAALLFIGGMLMLMLGLVGEYIGRIYITINSAPQYVVRSKINL